MRVKCDSCDRPQRVCLCAVLPKQPLMTRTRIIILQHPHETRHKLATASVVARCLSNCEVFVGRRFRPGNCALLDECALTASSSSLSAACTDGLDVGGAGKCRNCGENRTVLLLFPTSTATDLRMWFRSSPCSTCSSLSPSEQGITLSSQGSGEDDVSSTSVLRTEEQGKLSGSLRSLHLTSDCPNEETRVCEEMIEDKMDKDCHESHVILLIVDGTWQHAKEMVKASLPFIDNFVIQVSLPHDISREGWGMGDSDSVLRKEPYAGCVSTMEAVARALAVLEPSGSLVESTLLSVLQLMVKLQASHFTPRKPRPRLTKNSGGKEASPPAWTSGEKLSGNESLRPA